MTRPARQELTPDETRRISAVYAGQTALAVLTLLTSGGTLLCCALPILLVSLGLGAAVAGLTSGLPWLVALSEHKAWIFAGSLLLLIVAGWLIRRSAARCPAEPHLAQLCGRVNRINRRLLGGAVVIWITGFFAAFLLLPMQSWISG